jgi:predicted RNA-binding protein with PUA-like domain
MEIIFIKPSAPGIVGIAQVASTPYSDPTQYDPKSLYYDAKSTRRDAALVDAGDYQRLRKRK